MHSPRPAGQVAAVTLSGPMGALHVFDLDGTLLPATTTSLELAKVTGHLDALHALESRFGAGDLDTKGFAAAVHELWSDLTTAQVSAAFSAARRLGRVAEVIADVRDRGERSVVITMSPNFFVNELLALGTDEVIASRFPPLPFAGAPLDPTGILTPGDKPRLVRKHGWRNSISPSSVASPAYELGRAFLHG